MWLAKWCDYGGVFRFFFQGGLAIFQLTTVTDRITVTRFFEDFAIETGRRSCRGSPEVTQLHASSFFFLMCLTHVTRHRIMPPPHPPLCLYVCFIQTFLLSLFFFIFIVVRVCFLSVLHANLLVVTSFFQLMSGLLAASWLKWSGVVCCFQAPIVSLSGTPPPSSHPHLLSDIMFTSLRRCRKLPHVTNKSTSSCKHEKKIMSTLKQRDFLTVADEEL